MKHHFTKEAEHKETMARTQRSKKTGKSKTPKKPRKKAALDPIFPEFNRLEFHRHGLAIVPEPKDPDPGIAFLVKTRPHILDHFGCTCEITSACRHLRELEILAGKLASGSPETLDYHRFEQSLWYRLAKVLADDCPETPGSVNITQQDSEHGRQLAIEDSNHQSMALWFGESSDIDRFNDRFDNVPPQLSKYSRSKALMSLSGMVCSESERILNKKGVVTRRQDLENNFWYRFAYHTFREFNSKNVCLSPEIDGDSGAFSIKIGTANGRDIVRIRIPKNSIKKILTDILPKFKSDNSLVLHPEPLKPSYRFRMISENELEVSPLICCPSKIGDGKEIDIGEMANFVYGNLVYLKEFGTLVELEKPSRSSPINKNERMIITGDDIPHFLCKLQIWNQNSESKTGTGAGNIKVHQDQLNLKITPETLDRDWCWLSFEYAFGQSTLSLNDIFAARKRNKRFLKVENGWVDCNAPHFQEAEMILNRQPAGEAIKELSKLKVTRLELLRLCVLAGTRIDVNGKKHQAQLLKKLVNLQPAGPLPSLAELITPLRHYQEHGVNWLLYLWENSLGGLLCDDMGLGKTHQIMALMAVLKQRNSKHQPFLIVCPTTVISHWHDKIHDHAPRLKAAIYHGSERHLESILEDRDVLITSYGVLRNDMYKLKDITFALSVFDEAQYLKNQQTQVYLAALELNSVVKVGLTGTPIENKAMELKALFDVVLPGYLGSDQNFELKYTNPLLLSSNATATKQLRKIISPFVLRRLKQTVLDELPDKIEDIRGCLLSEEQVKLYQEAISVKGSRIQNALETLDKPIPYIHIFALLTILKQICDHPAVATGKVDEYDRYASGKWDLFKELLAESLESGQKVVVFSQFLNMIHIIEKYLTAEKIGFVTLTGSSRKRGKIVSQFNNDDQCRVFIGSLMAGGTGIDLVAGSVVIHYDRWWNAAREDQATDRLHRIGQKNVVQVFKLVTKGTLEEKISALIDKKRKLMENIIQEDDPDVLKTISRQDLMDLISAPNSL